MGKRSKKEAAREHYEALAQSRARHRRDPDAEAQKAAQFRATLKRKRDSETSDMISREISRLDIPWQHHWPEAPRHPESFPDAVAFIHGRAPKLVPVYVEALWVMYRLPWVRELADWEPAGKGRESLLRSLAVHLFAKYPQPQILWSAFTEAREVADELAPVAARVAAGESFAKLIKDGELPFPLTKKQCHTILQTPANLSLLAGIRRSQVQAHDGSRRLFQVWRATRPAQRVGTVRQEAFWDSVLAFFAKNPMLDLAQLNPLVDYLAFRINENAAFSMKGRTPAALIRDMEEWHGSLARKPVGTQTYKPSGFRGGEYQRNYRDRSGNYIREMWRVDEILTAKDLAAEGRTHGHCVYSYQSSIMKGHTSIWSMSHQGQRMLTIELRNQYKRVVQARGKYNRKAKIEEFRVLNNWAKENRLEVSLGQW